MKSMKLTAVLFALFVFLPLSAEAKVSSKHDSFREFQYIKSTINNVGFFDHAILLKSIAKNNSTEYGLSFTKISLKEWYFFSPKGSAVKIDGEIQELSTINTSHDYKSSTYKPELITSVMFNLTPLADKLKTAQSVTFRIYFDNQPSVDLVVPDKVLAEWKEVINTEK